MFFSPELLAKRDSGFGFLWLAATLGSKSAFKKLPKRSVLTADISQLCELISEPVEPLALRLSSNLMFGVVRVYKVKQDIFMTDVTNCVTSLKKVVQDIRSLGPIDAQLEMAQPTTKSSALTVTADPRTAYAMDFDALVADWDEFLSIRDRSLGDDDEDGYAETDSKRARKRKTGTAQAPPTETARRDLHTLTEHHEHLFSASFDLSFSRSGLDGPEISSSQNDVAFDFNDNPFALSDGLDLGDLGDELARELGWEPTPSVRRMDEIPAFEQNVIVNNFDMEFDLDEHDSVREQTIPLTKERTKGSLIGKRKNRDAGETRSPESNRGSASPRQTMSPGAISFSHLLLSQDIEQAHIRELNERRESIQPEDTAEKGTTRNTKNKKPRLFLDIRTELTDEELKTSRAEYLQAQSSLRGIMNSKKHTKFSSKVIEELIWSAPKGIYAQSLIDYWEENFKIQVEARSGLFQSREDNDPPRKRFKALQSKSPIAEEQPEIDVNDNIETGNMGQDYDMAFFENGSQMQGPGHLRSSEEPGQARHNSRAPSILGSGNFGLDNAEQGLVPGSQRSSLFPWDNAGGSSSIGNAPSLESGGIPVDQADIILRPSLRSRRDSSLIPSQAGSNAVTRRFSPLLVGRDSQAMDEDYVFDVDNAQILDETQDTQQVDMNLITLEKNSFHFLEYAKMQSQTLPKPGGQLTFDTVVPMSTSTRHVAAAAFYHCLVLATKDLLKLGQGEAYGQLYIFVK